MISEVRDAFNKALRDRLAEKVPDVYRVLDAHEIKEKFIEETCSQLIRASKKFDLRYHQRYDKIVDAAAVIYAKKVLNTLHEKTLSNAEMTRIKREEDKDKILNDLIKANTAVTDDLLEKYKERL